MIFYSVDMVSTFQAIQPLPDQFETFNVKTFLGAIVLDILIQLKGDLQQIQYTGT